MMVPSGVGVAMDYAAMSVSRCGGHDRPYGRSAATRCRAIRHPTRPRRVSNGSANKLHAAGTVPNDLAELEVAA